MKENICFYEEDESLKNCGFFEFLCKIGFEFNNKFLMQMPFLRLTKQLFIKNYWLGQKTQKNV